MLIPALLVDIDGTLSSDAQRAHLRPTGSEANSDIAWQRYFSLMGEDQPFLTVFEFVREKCKEIKVPPVIITGRPRRFWRLTAQWLGDYGFIPNASIFRQDDDIRPNVEYKAYALRIMHDDGYLPIVAIDDKPEILALWCKFSIKHLYLADHGRITKQGN